MVRIREPIEDQQPGDTKQLHSHHEQSKEEDNKKKENPDDGDKDDVNSRRKTKRRKRMVQEMTNDVRSVQFSSRLMWPSRGLDFNKAVDWVVQVDCPEDC